MKNFETSWAELVIDNRLLCIGAFFLLLALSVIGIVKYPVKHDNSFEMFMLKDDPNIEKFENFRDLFGDAEYLSVGVTARSRDSDLFVSDTIKIIDEISTMLEDHEHVTKVSSLSKYQYTHDQNGVLVTDNLFDNPSSLEEKALELLQARKIMSTELLAHGRIITKDLQHTRVLVRTEYIRNENDHKVKLSNDIYDFLKKKKYSEQGYKIRLGGGAIIAERFEALSERDTQILNPLVAAIMCLILYFLYGSITACILPWFLIGTSVVLVRALQAWLSFPNTVVNSALMPTLMIIGMGVSVHVLSEFFTCRNNGVSSKSAAKTVVKNLFKPIFFTAFTTSVGFGALAVTELVPVKQYAVLAGAGSLIIFLVAMTLFACLLSLITIYPKHQNHLSLNVFVVNATKLLANYTRRNRKLIAFIAILFVTFCIWSVPKISVDSNIFNYFKSNNWINQDMEYFDKLYKFSGIEVVVDSGRVDGIKDPQFLKNVEALEKQLNSFSETGKVNSVINFLKKLRQSLNSDDIKFFILPETSDMAAQLLLMYENSGPDDDLSDSIDFNNRFLRLSVPIENLSASEFARFYKFVRAEIFEQFPELKIDYTGPMVLYNAQEIYINEGLKQSFALALTTIGISFFILFGSFKYGFIALFPSVLPILIVGGLTTFIGISLDLGTIIVGAMCMGIAVDDAIHVMARYLRYRSKGFDTHKSIDLSVRESGKAVIFTSIILVCGFSVMLFASLVPTILFGVFVAFIMGLALLGDLFVLPALLFIFDGHQFHRHKGEKK